MLFVVSPSYRTLATSVTRESHVHYYHHAHGDVGLAEHDSAKISQLLHHGALILDLLERSEPTDETTCALKTIDVVSIHDTYRQSM